MHGETVKITGCVQL